MPYCTHIWYDDWTCSECCLGDRCNYYVIVSLFVEFKDSFYDMLTGTFLEWRSIFEIFDVSSSACFVFGYVFKITLRKIWRKLGLQRKINNIIHSVQTNLKFKLNIHHATKLTIKKKSNCIIFNKL